MALDQTRCWNAVLHKDKRQDGRFVYAVRSTKIFCRPSCPSRLARRENVCFFSDGQQALRHGFRACLRCHPLLKAAAPAHTSLMADMCRYIEARAEQPLSLSQLSQQAQMSQSHFQRTFTALIGVSPKAFHTAARMRRLKVRLKQQEPVTVSIFESGFGSTSRLYENTSKALGMTPSRYRQGAVGETISYTTQLTRFGVLLLAATDRGVCRVDLGDSIAALTRALRQEYPKATLLAASRRAQKHLAQWMTALTAHLERKAPRPDLPLDLRGTAFQLRVWNFLCSVPPGETKSYRQVAEAVGRPRAVRAAASACAANRLALLVPCHRILRQDGQLGGYRWGVERKAKLLASEQATQNESFANT
jgi:AraC family transcriptional regulator, regulatory protein of adaptative response / methylated-DNA-[protein]-cysteine methyltransferase